MILKFSVKFHVNYGSHLEPISNRHLKWEMIIIKFIVISIIYHIMLFI